MTDNEIIKALECCQTEYERKCKQGCPYMQFQKKCISVDTCGSRLRADLLALINRQKAEIESLRSQCSAKDVIINSQEAEIERLKKILDKRCDKCPAAITAIKKFINELEARCTEGGIYPAFVARTAENIAEEMTKKGEN